MTESPSPSCQPVLDALPAAVAVYDDGGHISYLNRRAQEILGVPDGSPPERVDRIFGYLPHRWLADGGAREVEVDLGDASRWLGFRTEALDGDHGVSHLLIFQDITEALAERREHRRFLDVEAMSHLLPSIAHQIVNPLAGIQSLVEVLIEETEHAGHREDLKTVLAEISRIDRHIRQLGLANRDLRTEADAIDVAEIARASLETFRHQARQFDVNLTYQGDESLVDRMDRDGLGYLVNQLLTNAIEACRRGDQILVSLEREAPPSDEGQWSLVVRDTGVGMTAQTMEQAADPFFSTKPGSSGIGLTLVREMVERSGGRLSSSSQPGQGTRVAVTFPFAQDS